MGSLFSRPSLPSTNYSYTPAPSVSTPTPDTPTSDIAGDSAEKIAAITRRRSLPETIRTSFRGVLEQGSWVPQRKSLLGE